MLTLRQIEVFRAFMQAGTVSAAAEQLHISQPTLTKTLSRMEKLMEVTLFRRTAGRLVPTPDALRLMAETEASYTDLQNAIQRVLRGVHAQEGVLRVGAQPSLTRKLAAPALAALVGRMPKASVHLDTLPVAEILDYVRNGPGECALTVIPIISADVVSVELGTLRGMALIPRSSGLAASGRPLTARAAAREPIITFEPHAVHARLAQDFFAAQGIKPARTHMARFADTAVALAEAGIGIAIVDQVTALGADAAHVRARPLASGGELSVYLHRPRHRRQSRLCVTFEQAVTKLLAELTGHAPRL
jgi:DNA-binding transcriptional LysR family regulator